LIFIPFGIGTCIFAIWPNGKEYMDIHDIVGVWVIGFEFLCTLVVIIGVMVGICVFISLMVKECRAAVKRVSEKQNIEESQALLV
jgi:hypothetical protein